MAVDSALQYKENLKTVKLIFHVIRLFFSQNPQKIQLVSFDENSIFLRKTNLVNHHITYMTNTFSTFLYGNVSLVLGQIT